MKTNTVTFVVDEKQFNFDIQEDVRLAFRELEIEYRYIYNNIIKDVIQYFYIDMDNVTQDDIDITLNIAWNIDKEEVIISVTNFCNSLSLGGVTDLVSEYKTDWWKGNPKFNVFKRMLTEIVKCMNDEI